MNARILTLFIILGLIWGSAFVGIEILVHYLAPWFGAAVRVSVACLGLYAILVFKKTPLLPPKGSYFYVAPVGLLAIGIPFSLLFWGEQRVAAGVASILNGSVPLWTAFYLIFHHRGKLHPLLYIGVFIGFCGLVCIFYPALEGSLHQSDLWALLAILGMALCYTVSNLINQKILTETKGLHFETAVFHQHLLSAVYLWILSALFEPWHWPAWDAGGREAFIAVIYLGIVPSALAFLIYFMLLKNIGALKTGVVTYLIPVSALTLDFLAQGHIPRWNALIGVILIIWGLFFVRSTPKKA